MSIRNEIESNNAAWEHSAVTLDIPVRFAETDQMGVVHHSAYLVWMEAGRIAWLNAAGIPYTEIAGGGNHFAVTGISVAYRNPARFGDVVQVVTRLESLRSRQVSFIYDVRNAASGAHLAAAKSEHICVDLDGQMTRIPAEIVARMLAGARELARS